MGSRLLSARLFDVYPASGGMAVWLLAEGGARLRLVHPWSPRLYYAGAPAALGQAAALLDGSALHRDSALPGGPARYQVVRDPVTVRRTKRQDLLQGEVEVVEVTVADPLAFPRLVARLARIDGLTFHNCH